MAKYSHQDLLCYKGDPVWNIIEIIIVIHLSGLHSNSKRAKWCISSNIEQKNRNATVLYIILWYIITESISITSLFLCCTLRLKKKGEMVIRSSTTTVPWQRLGPPLPDRGHFQYPESTDDGAVARHARYPVPKAQWTCADADRGDPTGVRSQVAATRGGTASANPPRQKIINK